jgi:Holliday junction resolvase RusA-like endonuclease
MIEIRVPGEAVSATVKVVRLGRYSGIRKGSAAEAWEGRIATAAQETRGSLPLIEGPVIVSVLILAALPKTKAKKRAPQPESWKTTKPDVDKIARCVLDALTGIVYVDDAQVCALDIRKRVAAQGLPAETIIRVDALTETA